MKNIISLVMLLVLCSCGKVLKLAGVKDRGNEPINYKKDQMNKIYVNEREFTCLEIFDSADVHPIYLERGAWYDSVYYTGFNREDETIFTLTCKKDLESNSIKVGFDFKSADIREVGDVSIKAETYEVASGVKLEDISTSNLDKIRKDSKLIDEQFPNHFQSDAGYFGAYSDDVVGGDYKEKNDKVYLLEMKLVGRDGKVHARSKLGFDYELIEKEVDGETKLIMRTRHKFFELDPIEN